jgi:ribokinase
MNAPVVVGSYIQDLTFFTAQFPNPGETIIGTFKTGPGGKGSNQAIAAVRACVPAVFIGAVGQDAFASVAQSIPSERRGGRTMDWCSGCLKRGGIDCGE